jgi:uncharacterized membrane protein
MRADTLWMGATFMAYGPLEYYIIGFEGRKLSGEVASALKSTADSGAIKILDLVFVSKDKAGAVTRIEYQDFDPDVARAFAALDRNADGMFSGEDLEQIGEAIDPNSSAVLVLVEHRWAANIREAVVRARGRLIHNGILTEDIVHELERANA